MLHDRSWQAKIFNKKNAAEISVVVIHEIVELKLLSLD